ncbi:methylcobamide--CoM methyltransferase [Parabacteroides sp. AM58-2XD]|uniref:uroporphyrinogen decarboxylase family protein n=1 Tax=Parabacteroides TaxID=375288 RepID=UPI000FE1C929|nr:MULTISPECIES: uroporphyrinogen decarboxylase family protein [Parabacteroides]RGY99739.1 methylcobamide--CoM methyltransferase [Parabacteroides sp. AM58-2XD]GKG76612.1 methylcobamide--CoM methyltransferase [Parabacteroides goldsteinii]GKG79980.1 methylcobamide--CoM methyltransferase [Parabacteroides goldsteinii]
MEIQEWLQETIRQKERRAIPIMTHPGIELCGKTVRDAVTSGMVHADAICRLNEQYPSAAPTVIMDLTVEAEAFGAKVVFPEDEVPSVTEPLVSDKESIDNLQIPSLDTARVPEYLKANRLTAERVKDKPVFAGCIGPFSLAGRLFGLSELMIALYVEPENITVLLEKCTRFLIDYCRAIKETGVHGVIMAEPAAGLISNEDSLLYSTTYVRQVVEAVQDEHFIVILHNCGNAGHCTEAMVQSGAAALHFGNKIDMQDALANCPEDRLVMGNLDPVGLFKQSSSEEVYTATMNLLQQTKAWKNFVLSTGCDVPPHIPAENIEAFCQALIDFNRSM